MTQITHTTRIGNREYRVEGWENSCWYVISQPINKKSGKAWQAYKYLGRFNDHAGAVAKFNEVTGAKDELDMLVWEPCPVDPDASKADAEIIARRR